MGDVQVAAGQGTGFGVVVKFLGDGEWIKVLQGPGLGCSWVKGSGLGHC